MNKLKLVGLDMDGTLLGKDRSLTQHTIDTLEKVAATGVHLVVDSGRKFEVVPKELRELPFMRYFVLSNGAEIYDKWEDKVLYRAEIPFHIAMDIYDSLTSHPEVYLDCYHSDGSWARAEDHARIDEFVEDQSHRDVLRNTRTPIENMREKLVARQKPVQKFQTIYKNTAIRDKEMKRISALYPQMGITSAYTYNLEVNVPDATKGIGLLKLAELLDLERDQVIAFGDGENDLSMIEGAGIGYAMANAPDNVKEAAGRIAPPDSTDHYENLKLVVNEIKTDDSDYTVITTVLGDSYKKILPLDISLEDYKGDKTQPNGKITVSVPIPESWDVDNIEVIYVADDGTKTLISSQPSADGKYILFETDHFSSYVLAEAKQTNTKQESTTSPQTGDNSNMILWISLLIVSAFGLAGTSVLGKKKTIR